MRDYSIAVPRFWTGDTGKRLRALGRDHQVIAFYLFTCPNANMIGLYYLPLPTLCHEVGGVTSEGALEVLRSLSEVGYAHYDEASDHVYIPGMAAIQVGESLTPKDNRCKAVARLLIEARKTPFFEDFLLRYAKAYHLADQPELEGLISPFEAPPKSGSGSGSGTGTGSGTQSARVSARSVSRETGPTAQPVDPGRLLSALQVVYPKGTYRQSEWLLAQRHALARIDEGETLDALLAGCSRYAAQCEAKGSVGSQFVLSPSKFFQRGAGGSPAPYTDPFPLPAEKSTATERLLAALDSPKREVIEHAQSAAILR